MTARPSRLPGHRTVHKWRAPRVQPDPARGRIPQMRRHTGRLVVVSKALERVKGIVPKHYGRKIKALEELKGILLDVCWTNRCTLFTRDFRSLAFRGRSKPLILRSRLTEPIAGVTFEPAPKSLLLGRDLSAACVSRSSPLSQGFMGARYGMVRGWHYDDPADRP
jgi:hypothetical protein